LLDTHAHILWNLDDGSKNLDMSVQMLQIAAGNETKAIFATPHVIEKAAKPSWVEIKEKTQRLQQLALEEQIDITLYPGAEVQMNWELLTELGEEGAYCLNGGSYLLVELPAAEIPVYADEFWYELELKGITPILAHPERYQKLNENPDLILLWRRRGILMQCNSGSFTGMFGSSVCENAKALLNKGLVDLLGSDGHRSEGRNTDMSKAAAVIKQLVGEEKLRQITETNPQTILKNQQIELKQPKVLLEDKPKSFWQKLFGK
jgi:protein-tyrosine phosphatase